ncbi:MAG: cyclase family protein [Dehalococcoidia bacterium]|nr:cyclase family protein [Dehalococcoidia bacterium]
MSLADRRPPTVNEYAAYRQRFSNWGRWGPDDRLGTLNHITPEVRVAATRLVHEGRAVSLAVPFRGPARAQLSSGFEQTMRIGESSSSDELTINFHGWTVTHLDALCHIFTDAAGQLYNGRPASDVTPDGALSGDVSAYADGIVTRGVLYDVPRFRGTPHVTLADPVHGWELRDIASAQGVEAHAGDAVIVRSGATAWYAATPDFGNGEIGRMPGVHASALEFLHATDAALLAWDLLDAGEQEYPGTLRFGAGRPVAMPIHEIAIPYLGMPLLDNADLDALAATCAELGRWEFLLVVAPLVVRGGTGSPVNPLALF